MIKKMRLHLDPVDRRILRQLQEDAGLTNQDLAERVGTSAATCLRRVRRLEELGVLSRRIALVEPDRLGPVLQAICEVTLDRQGVEHLDAFERHVLPHPAVQQCYRVSGGPDFVLVAAAQDMAAWDALAKALFTQQANVRNIRTYFVTRRGKFAPVFDCLLSPGAP